MGPRIILAVLASTTLMALIGCGNQSLDTSESMAKDLKAANIKPSSGEMKGGSNQKVSDKPADKN
ncbi:MAG: hypothetical protein J0H02_06235 [Armatimonadetes bacterium]|nr:hypothetical protein [Armatimonadota bacterium]